MSFNSGAIHHFHKRKREKNKKSEKLKIFLDKIIYAIGISSPIMTIPQIIQIYNEKSSIGISGLTWFWFLITAIIWLIYAIIHKEKPLIITNIAWVIVDIILLVQIFFIYP